MPKLSHPSVRPTAAGVVLTRVCAALAGIAVVWALILVDLQSDRELQQRGAMTRAQGYAISFAETLQKSIQQIDQLSMTLVQLHEARVSKPLLDRAYLGILDELPLYPIFLDEHGIARHARVAPKMVINLSQSEFFRFHRQSASRELRINPREQGVAAFAGQVIVRLSRRVNKPDGSFGGVVAITMLPRYLNAFNETSALSDNDFASVWLADGPMLTNRTRGWAAHTFQHFKQPPQLPGDTGKRYESAETFLDNGAHFVGWKRLAHYPLVALVALTEDNVMAELRGSELTHYGSGTLVSLLIALLAASSAMTTLRRDRARQKIARAEARYRHAMDRVREAVFLLENVSAAGDSPDFVVEDCNAQALRLAGAKRDDVIGRGIDALFGPDDAPPLREAVRDALAQGSARLQMKSEGRGQPVWYFVNTVMIDGSIALTLHDVTDLKLREQQVLAMSMSDPLTLLHNRLWLDQYLDGALQTARQESRQLALLLIELDNFRLINDTLGHKVGDKTLVSVAVALRRALRANDHVARIGGNSFAVLVEGIEAGAVEPVAAQLRAGLRGAHWPDRAAELAQKVSIGMATYPEDAQDAVGLLKAAELALASAAAGGDAARRFDPSLLQERENRLWVEHALPQAIRNGELRMYLQPRVFARTGRLASFEALARWQHPQRGLLMPATFIPVAEETGLIVPLGEWMLRAACSELGRWKRLGLAPVPVAVNVSAQQLQDGSLGRLIVGCLRHYELSPSLLAIELTESMMIGDDERVLGELQRLRGMGIELHIDDFGTGYSSLSQLQRVDIDALKVDQSFVRALGVRGQGRQLCEAVVGIGKSLGATVVAEGVESIDQFRALQAMGCDEMQGFLASAAVPTGEAEAMLRQPQLIHLDRQLVA